MLSVEVSKAWVLNPNVLRYRHGMVQPGLLIVNNFGEVIYGWSSTASVTNLFGTTDRPKPKDVWAAVVWLRLLVLCWVLEMRRVEIRMQLIECNRCSLMCTHRMAETNAFVRYLR